MWQSWPASASPRTRSSGWPASFSGILEHVDRIAELDLDDVEPTSHVVELENVLRADVPHESLPPEVALASAPDPAEGAFRVPSPQAEE